MIDLAEAQAGDVEARNRIVMRYYRVLERACRRHAFRHCTEDELLGAAFVGMTRAIATYDPKRGAFEPFARLWVDAFVRASRRKQVAMVQRNWPHWVGVKFVEFEGVSPENTEAFVSMKERIDSALAETEYAEVVVDKIQGLSHWQIFQARGVRYGAEHREAMREFRKQVKG